MDERKRVLIVEAHDALRVMLFTVLRHEQLDVDTAADGLEALEKVKLCDYALILLDVGVEGLDAAGFLEQFREFRPETTSFIIAVTENASVLDLDPRSVNAILQKPFEIATLADVVREIVAVIPPPPDPLPCPPAESAEALDDSGGHHLN